MSVIWLTGRTQPFSLFGRKDPYLNHVRVRPSSVSRKDLGADPWTVYPVSRSGSESRGGRGSGPPLGSHTQSLLRRQTSECLHDPGESVHCAESGGGAWLERNENQGVVSL